jgi:hypothetical protein
MDVPARLLAFIASRLPESLIPWSEAMLAELSFVEGSWARLQWAAGGVFALATAQLRMKARAHGWRLDVFLIAAYHLVFAAILIGVLTWQLPQIKESWKYAVPALAICYLLSALPAVLGLGLLLRDDAARIGTLLFSLAHILLTCGTMSHTGNHWGFPAFRIGIDALMVVILLRPKVSSFFRTSPIMLHLRNQNGGPA